MGPEIQVCTNCVNGWAYAGIPDGGRNAPQGNERGCLQCFGNFKAGWLVIFIRPVQVTILLRSEFG
jgi:hypothetical protein